MTFFGFAPNCQQKLAFAWQRVLLSIAGLAVVSGVPAATPDASTSTLDSVTVIGVSLVPGADVAADKLAGNIQSATGDELEFSNAFDITEFLARSMGSVYVNDTQGNPLQRDLQMRGFVASPLLGMSQGISVYQDGVRLNEPFGDTVNWALIPDNALANIDLIPGSNPLFGQNTLGGALVLTTKSGFTHAGVTGELLYGSANRITAAATFGAANNDTAYFIAATQSQEDGWRDYSPTRATQVFADVRHRYSAGEIGLSLTYADTDLIGNGPAPDSLLASDRHAIFTRPDQTQNTLWLLNAGGTWNTSDSAKFILRLYERHSDVATLNGDDSDFEECDLLPGLVCIPGENDEPALDQNGNVIAFGAQVAGATLNRSSTEQVGRGMALQWVSAAPLFGYANHFVVGGSADDGISDFTFSTELGALDDSRQAIGSGTFVADAAVELAARTSTYSLFVGDTLSLPSAAVTLAGRYYRQDMELRDGLGTELNGDHRFSRLNPSLGVVTPVTKTLALYGSYAQASRTPSPVELTCANPDAPCRLPNAFLSDPPLKQVVANSFEAGARGKWENGHWHAGVFRTDSRDDIIFISAGALTNQGYFANVDATRRQGFELLFAGKIAAKLNWFLNYTWLDATFGGDLEIASVHNPEAVDGVIKVQRGDRLPGVPQHLAKTGVDYEVGRWSAAVDANYAASQYVRGDEANLLDPLPGFVTVNAQIGYQMADQVNATFGIHNVFDRKYATFATLGNADEVLGTTVGDERFSTPAAPRSLWVTVRVKL
jgi:outer membrane receptor protein involved in Fe transport